MGYSLKGFERETVIRFDEEGEQAEVYTASPVWIRKMDRMVTENPAAFMEVRTDRIDGEVVAKSYQMPKGLLSIRAKKRVLSEEQKAAAAARLSEMRRINSEVRTPLRN